MSSYTYDLLTGGEQRGIDLLAGGEQKTPELLLSARSRRVEEGQNGSVEADMRRASNSERLAA